MRRFPPGGGLSSRGGYKVKDANGQALAYVYARETERAAQIANVLTEDEARQIASNIAKLPKFFTSERLASWHLRSLIHSDLSLSVTPTIVGSLGCRTVKRVKRAWLSNAMAMTHYRRIINARGSQLMARP